MTRGNLITYFNASSGKNIKYCIGITLVLNCNTGALVLYWYLLEKKASIVHPWWEDFLDAPLTLLLWGGPRTPRRLEIIKEILSALRARVESWQFWFGKDAFMKESCYMYNFSPLNKLPVQALERFVKFFIIIDSIQPTISKIKSKIKKLLGMMRINTCTLNHFVVVSPNLNSRFRKM